MRRGRSGGRGWAWTRRAGPVWAGGVGGSVGGPWGCGAWRAWLVRLLALASMRLSFSTLILHSANILLARGPAMGPSLGEPEAQRRTELR